MLDQLESLVEQVNAPNVDANEKLMQLIKNIMEQKTMEKMNESIVAQQVQLDTLATNLEKNLKEIIQLFQ